MKSHPGVAARRSRRSRELGVEPQVRRHLADQDRLLRPHDDVEKTVKALHEAFDLGSPEAERQHA